MQKLLPALLFLFTCAACKTQKAFVPYASENLKVDQLSPNSYRHLTYLQTDDWGKVGCNGMIVTAGDEALIFDTPTNEADAKELIEYVENTLGKKVAGVVATHFHDDCVGGLNEFHSRGIPSYAYSLTIPLAEKEGNQVPQLGFDSEKELKVGNSLVTLKWVGEGHTRDNIVAYFPDEKVLFGGCLVKEVGANKGYLGDANEAEWSNTIHKVKGLFPDVKVIIPGHGKTGGMELLDYTEELFRP